MRLPGGPNLHPQVRPLCDWSDYNSPDDSLPKNTMLIMDASRGHPASLQMIHELRMVVEILTDDTSGAIIPEARLPLSHALLIARGVASMWPGTRPLVAEYLQSVCAWEWEDQSSSSGESSTNNIHNRPPPPEPPLILPPDNPDLHRLIDLKTYDEMREAKNWLELQHVSLFQALLWLVSTEFLADEDAARRMRCFTEDRRYQWSLVDRPDHACKLLIAASAFRRWRCVDVVISKVRRPYPDFLHRTLRGLLSGQATAAPQAIGREAGDGHARGVGKRLWGD